MASLLPFGALYCVGVNVFSQSALLIWNALVSPGLGETVRVTFFSLANRVVKATNVNRTVCLEEEKHTFPGSGWCWEIKWLSASYKAA